MARGTRAGHDRERAVRKILEAQGWLVTRAAASLGVFDLVALQAGRVPMLVEVKSTTYGPWDSFGPADRERCRVAALAAGGEAWLAWWPPRKDLVWVDSSEWPT